MTEAQLVQAYLQDRDFICPDCRYNLRGLNSSVCPECGLGFRLTLAPIAGTWSDPKLELQRLTDYLETHDARCPSCRTGLRGHNTLECPRCQMPLSVWLLRPRGIRPGDSVSILIVLALILLLPIMVMLAIILF